MAVAAPVGPMSLLCIHRTLDHGQKAGLVFGAGVAAGDLTYAAMAAFGITAISALLVAGSFWIKASGSLLLILLGVRIAVARPQAGNPAALSASARRSFLTAYGLTLSNPPTILFFAGIFATVASFASPAQSVTFAAGVFAGSMAWWVILTFLVARSARLFRPPLLRWVNRVSGAVLVAFGLFGLMSPGTIH